jgi:MoaA/NifB/PqqE/SkfB family radical SAM enzyme
MDMSNILKKYVCTMPFKYTDIQTNGQFVCCPSWNGKNINSNGLTNLSENWKNTISIDIRKSVMDGTYEYCNKTVCPKLNELINTNSVPKEFLEINTFKTKYKINSTEDLVNFTKSPEEILFGFDKSCNLKCPSCRVNLIPNDDINSTYNELKMNILKSIENDYGGELKKIMITGSGDPIYSKIYRDYLINFDKTKYPKLQKIHLITNGNLLDEKMWNSFKAKEFIKIIEISIDAATKETYENSTRLNGNWNRLINNLKYLSTQNTIDEFYFSMVVSKNNYKEMEMFYNLIIGIFGKSKFKYGYTIVYRQLVDWNTYLPTELKELQVFEKGHELYDDFVIELEKINNKKNVNHNFNHISKMKKSLI